MTDSEIRNKGKTVLTEYLDKEKNIEIIEKNIYNISIEKKTFKNSSRNCTKCNGRRYFTTI